jgi:hypothetical protein
VSLDFEIIDLFDPLDLQVPRGAMIAAGRAGEPVAPTPSYTGMGRTYEMPLILDDIHAPE